MAVQVTNPNTTMGPSGAGHASGVVPDPGATSGITRFLREDATFRNAVQSIALAVPVEFNISGSPVTTSGTLTIGKADEAANQVWAGPASGGAAVPVFRALVSADLPLATSSVPGAVEPDDSTITVNGSGVITAATATVSALGVVKPDGSTITISGGVISAVGGSGNATSIQSIPVSSATPSTGNVLEYNGTNWTPTALVLATTFAPVAHEWLNSYTSTTGVFTASQPAFSDISGTATPAQLPVATVSALGAVQPDGSTVDVSVSGVISVPTATTSVLGLVKPDGSTITISGGVISSVGSGGGITQLTGDVTAGPGSGSQAATLAASGVTAGSYTNASITVNAKGLVTSASNGSSSAINFSDNEAVTISGTSGTLAHTPSPAASLQLFVPVPSFGSILLIQGSDYTLSGASITITNPSISTTSASAWYRY